MRVTKRNSLAALSIAALASRIRPLGLFGERFVEYRQLEQVVALQFGAE